MVEKLFVKTFVGFIKFYKKIISPFLGNNCRFHPTCSEYAIEAFNEYGLFKGLFLSTKRILKCNPLFKGGYDPVNGNDK